MDRLVAAAADEDEPHHAVEHEDLVVRGRFRPGTDERFDQEPRLGFRVRPFAQPDELATIEPVGRLRRQDHGCGGIDLARPDVRPATAVVRLEDPPLRQRDLGEIGQVGARPDDVGEPDVRPASCGLGLARQLVAGPDEVLVAVVEDPPVDLLGVPPRVRQARPDPVRLAVLERSVEPVGQGPSEALPGRHGSASSTWPSIASGHWWDTVRFPNGTIQATGGA